MKIFIMRTRSALFFNGCTNSSTFNNLMIDKSVLIKRFVLYFNGINYLYMVCQLIVIFF